MRTRKVLQRGRILDVALYGTFSVLCACADRHLETTLKVLSLFCEGNDSADCAKQEKQQHEGTAGCVCWVIFAYKK